MQQGSTGLTHFPKPIVRVLGGRHGTTLSACLLPSFTQHPFCCILWPKASYRANSVGKRTLPLVRNRSTGMGGIVTAMLANNLPHPVHLVLSPEEQAVRVGRLPDHLRPLMQKLRAAWQRPARSVEEPRPTWLVSSLHMSTCALLSLLQQVSLLSSSLARGCPC